MRFATWLERQKFSVVLFTGGILLALFFGAGAADWWIAQHVPWWGFGVLSLLVTVAITVGKTVRKLRKD